MQPLFVQVHPSDNVGIVANPGGLPAGAVFSNGLELREAIPQAHKVSLSALGAGSPVIRYGQTIGKLKRDLEAGRWVREDLVEMPEAPPLESLALATEVPRPQPSLTGYSFEGYRNVDGSAGTKNILGITTTVQCVAPTVEYAIRRIKAELLPRYPNVDDAVAITHSYGCGVAIDAPGAAIPIATLGHISRHANIAASPLVVSLGCEKMQPIRLLPQYDVQPNLIRLQDHAGFGEIVSVILQAAERRLAELDRRRRVTLPASELVVGLQCGGSDAFSGVTCNPAVGFASDLLVRAGATVLFSEVSEVRDGVHLLTPRCANEEVARDLIREMRWYDEYLARGYADRSANTTRGTSGAAWST